MFDVQQILQALVTGVGVGLIYGLVGIGYCVIYNASGIVNFAQGVFVMLGGMICHTLLTGLGLPIWVATVLTVPMVAAVGMIIEILVVKPMWDRNAALFAIILATLAAQIVIERIVIMTLGDQPRTFDQFTSGGPLILGPVAISYQTFWILGCGALLVGLLYLFFTCTRPGRALRACSQNREAAALLGIPVNRMLMFAFGLSAALGAIAGILVTPTQVTAYNSGIAIGISGFIAAILGGFGSASGAIAGGVLLGVLQSVATVLLGAAFRNIAALSILLIVLALFPAGIFARWQNRAQH